MGTFSEYELFAVSVSTNSFKGKNILKQEAGIGPDTGDRLFKTLRLVAKL